MVGNVSWYSGRAHWFDYGVTAFGLHIDLILGKCIHPHWVSSVLGRPRIRHFLRAHSFLRWGWISTMRLIHKGRGLFEKIKSSTRCVPACAKTNSDLVNISLDSFMRQDFTSIDEKFSLLIYLDSMVCKCFHDAVGFRTFRTFTVTPWAFASIFGEVDLAQAATSACTWFTGTNIVRIPSANCFLTWFLRLELLECRLMLRWLLDDSLWLVHHSSSLCGFLLSFMVCMQFLIVNSCLLYTCLHRLMSVQAPNIPLIIIILNLLLILFVLLAYDFLRCCHFIHLTD